MEKASTSQVKSSQVIQGDIPIFVRAQTQIGLPRKPSTVQKAFLLKLKD